jgi:hypothetical protein
LAREGERRGVYRVLVGRAKRKRTLGRTTGRWGRSFEKRFEINMLEDVLDAAGLR